ncbi:MAG TPA: 50S ribosomal protein L34e [archaeon]|nr:50S ribosomal protein L34e [archaeon]
MPRFKKRLAGGRVALRVKREKAGFVRCAKCGKVLHGIPRLHTVGMRRLAKTEKRVNRPFGGYYCSSCCRGLFREKARVI